MGKWAMLLLCKDCLFSVPEAMQHIFKMSDRLTVVAGIEPGEPGNHSMVRRVWASAIEDAANVALVHGRIRTDPACVPSGVSGGPGEVRSGAVGHLAGWACWWELRLRRRSIGLGVPRQGGMSSSRVGNARSSCCLW